MPNACGSADCGLARLDSLTTDIASKGCLKNGAIAIRLQPLGAIRSPETGPNRPGEGRQRTPIVPAKQQLKAIHP
jgi:hypothetical protein